MVASRARPGALGLVAAALGFIGWMTLRPVPASVTLPASCIICGPLGGVDFVLNIVLFAPLGFGLRWLLRRRWTPIAIGFAVTVLVESLQWRLIGGRDASLGDVLANTLGTALGSWLFVQLVVWRAATGRVARRMAARVGVATAAALSVSAWLVLPARTPTSLYVLWTVNRRNLDPFPGRLQSADLNGVALVADTWLPGNQLLDAQGAVTLRATVGGRAERTRRPALILSATIPRNEGFFFGQQGDAALYRVHLNASRLRLRPLLVRLNGALGVGTGESSDPDGLRNFEAVSDPRRVAITERNPGGSLTVTVPRTVGLGWTLFLPWDVAIDRGWWLASAAWLGALLMPVSWCVARALRDTAPDESMWGAGWPLFLVLGSLVAAPAATGVSPIGLREWCGVAAGAGTAFLAGRLTSRRDEIHT